VSGVGGNYTWFWVILNLSLSSHLPYHSFSTTSSMLEIVKIYVKSTLLLPIRFLLVVETTVL